jgi:hypothetical protein
LLHGFEEHGVTNLNLPARLATHNQPQQPLGPCQGCHGVELGVFSKGKLGL